MHSMDSAAGRHSPTTLGHRWARNTRSLGHLDKAEKSQSKTQPETSTTCNGESGTPKVEISASSLLSIKLKYTIWDHGRKSATSRNPQWFNITLLLVSNSGQLVATHNNVAGSTRLPFFWRHHTLASNSPGAAQEKKLITCSCSAWPTKATHAASPNVNPCLFAIAKIVSGSGRCDFGKSSQKRSRGGGKLRHRLCSTTSLGFLPPATLNDKMAGSVASFCGTQALRAARAGIFTGDTTREVPAEDLPRNPLADSGRGRAASTRGVEVWQGSTVRRWVAVLAEPGLADLGRAVCLGVEYGSPCDLGPKPHTS
mmetsp:Transcript_35963/g.76372  ORF Transcript_35963/g.76372 Transcript_35963/m.76372 type:complete len:312 (-) Transcript_35963:105-1040(-)